MWHDNALITFTKQLPSYKTGGTTTEKLLCCHMTTPQKEKQRKLEKIKNYFTYQIKLIASSL
jgi:hypothetical protein